MLIHLKLPLIELNNMKFDDDTYFYKGYQLNAWRGDIQKLNRSIASLGSVFFQDEITITPDLVIQAGLDVEYVTMEFANLLFSNLEKAAALQKYYDAKFNEIEVVWEGQNEESLLKIDNIEFSVFYESEFINMAVESYQGYIDDVSLQDIIGSFDNLINFDSYFNIDELWNKVIALDEAANMDLSEAPDDRFEAIYWISTKLDDSSEIWEILNNIFLFEKYAEESIKTFDDAKEYLDGLIGDIIFDESISVNGWKPVRIIIVQKF